MLNVDVAVVGVVAASVVDVVEAIGSDIVIGQQSQQLVAVDVVAVVVDIVDID